MGLSLNGDRRSRVASRRSYMPSPSLDPDVADLAPDDPVLTAYDEQHVVTYLRLLDADADNADWREVASQSAPLRAIDRDARLLDDLALDLEARPPRTSARTSSGDWRCALRGAYQSKLMWFISSSVRSGSVEHLGDVPVEEPLHVDRGRPGSRADRSASGTSTSTLELAERVAEPRQRHHRLPRLLAAPSPAAARGRSRR